MLVRHLHWSGTHRSFDLETEAVLAMPTIKFLPRKTLVNSVWYMMSCTSLWQIAGTPEVITQPCRVGKAKWWNASLRVTEGSETTQSQCRVDDFKHIGWLATREPAHTDY